MPKHKRILEKSQFIVIDSSSALSVVAVVIGDDDGALEERKKHQGTHCVRLGRNALKRKKAIPSRRKLLVMI
jgi:hypothetical protein